MWLFLLSSTRFIWRVLKLSFSGIVWWLLDATEFYSKLVKPSLPPRLVELLQPYVNHLDVATPFVVTAIVIWAVLYTYYEADKEVRRNPKVSKNLKKQYNKSGELLRQQISNENELVTLKQVCSAWFKETHDLISKNMESASLNRFLHFTMSLPYNHGNTLNDDHQITLNGLNIYHKNLQALIESQEWK